LTKPCPVSGKGRPGKGTAGKTTSLSLDPGHPGAHRRARHPAQDRLCQGTAGVVRRLRRGRHRCRGLPSGRSPRPAGAGVRVRSTGVLVVARRGAAGQAVAARAKPAAFPPASYRKTCLRHLPTGQFRRSDHPPVLRRGLNRALTAPSDGEDTSA
jgi:hypothetical protein